MPSSGNWELMTLHFDDDTPAKTVTSVANLNFATMEMLGGTITVKVTWGATADGNATVKWYQSADGGTTVSLERTDTLTVSAGNSKATSYRVMHRPFVRVTVLNGNTAVEDITLVLKVAGLRHGNVTS